jgi:4-hydroxybenzoate polyprenyltransferase
LRLIRAIINSNIYISVAAVFLTVETQIQLGMKPQWHPYLFIIFFATLFEYNLHRLITVLTNKEALNSDKHNWVKKNLKGFYLLVFLSVAGFFIVSFLARREVLITLAPLAILTLFYSTPVFRNKKNILRLRDIPYIKIFLIALVWSGVTILLPMIQADILFDPMNVILIFLERFIFVFAITLPFDIRDIEADKQEGLKTFPLLFDEKRSYLISYLSLLMFFIIAMIHYSASNNYYIAGAVGLSALTTFVFIKIRALRNLPYFHYGILDGTMLLQGILVLVFYYVRMI